MPSEFARHWTLDPAVAFLNHGSYGAAPRPVLAAVTPAAYNDLDQYRRLAAALPGAVGAVVA